MKTGSGQGHKPDEDHHAGRTSFRAVHTSRLLKLFDKMRRRRENCRLDVGATRHTIAPRDVFHYALVMQPRLAIVLGASLVLAPHWGCSSFSSADLSHESPDASSDLPTEAGAPLHPVEGSGSDAGIGITVKGLVVAAAFAAAGADKPVAESPVLVVDAVGKKFEATSDAQGVFSVRDVLPPYDLKVCSPPAVEPRLCNAYLGLSRPDVRTTIYAGPRDDVQKTGTVNVTVQFPDCGPSGCFAQMRTDSPLGVGQSTGYSATSQSVTVAVEHRWLTTSAKANASENVTTDILISDRSWTKYWYARVGPSPLAPDAAQNVFVTPAQVSSVGPITITVNDSDVPDAWRRDLQASLNLPSFKTALPMQRVESSSLVTLLPNIPGGTFKISTSRTLRDANGMVTRIVSTTSPKQALSTSSVSLSVTKGLDMVRPAEAGATFSRSTSARFEWQKPKGAWVSGFTLYDEAPPSRRLAGTFYMDGNELALDRLTRLGVVLHDGAYSLELDGYVGTVAAVVEPDPAKSLDLGGQVGMWTSQQFQFLVAP